MLLSSRRFSVWLVSFLAVLVVYFIYNRLSRTPPITAGDMEQTAELITDACDSSVRVGMVGEVGVGVVKNIHYTTLNSQKQVEREFGFEKLLHQDGNDWEIEKPYMRIFRRSYRCEISAERARVTVETAGGKVTPKEGLLSGSVTVWIWPRSKKGVGAGVMHLDDITFVGDKSMFSTPGIVEYASDEVRFVGKGMELIYNSDDERLEYLKIEKLQSLHIKRGSEGSLFGSGATGQDGKKAPAKEISAESGKKYRCVLDSNVVIETPRERLLADIVSINDILERGGSSEDSNAEAGAGEEAAQETTGVIGGGRDVRAAAFEQGEDVSVSCNGGIIITPMDSAGEQKAEDGRRKTEHRTQNTEDRRDGKTTFFGERVDYSVATGEAVATGPSQITFSAGRLTPQDAYRRADVNDRTREAAGKPARFEITAQKQVVFTPASNKSVFEGDCQCSITQALLDATRQYVVRAEKLEVDLMQKGGAEAGSSSLEIRRFIATGGDVHLASTKSVGQRLLTGVELKCARMDYDTVDENFVAAGPGLIKMDNSQTDEPQKGLSRFSLRRKCYAFLRNFDTLEFNGRSNRLAADSPGGSLLVDYFPVVSDSRGVIRLGPPQEDKVGVTASHVEADLFETAQGRTEMKGLVAEGAVTYQDKNTQVVGSEFVYDANSASIDISGDRSRPCYFNGAIIDAAQYNVKSGKWNTRIKGPGAIK